MKTTIDLPEALYRRAKFQCVERKQTLRDLVIASLERELGAPGPRNEVPYWSRRNLRSGYAEALEAGAYTGGADSSSITSEDRDSREGSLL